MQNPGTPNAWTPTKETTKDITNAIVTKGGEAMDALKSGAGCVGKKTYETAGNVQDATGELADATCTETSCTKGFDALISGAADLILDQTKDTAGDMTTEGSGIINFKDWRSSRLD